MMLSEASGAESQPHLIWIHRLIIARDPHHARLHPNSTTLECFSGDNAVKHRYIRL